jgi:hypothetical protein
MPTLNLTINAKSISKEITADQAVGFAEAFAKVNDQIVESETEDSPKKHSSKEAYLEKVISDWATSNSAEDAAVSAMIDQCLNSWSKTPVVQDNPETPPELTGDDLKNYLISYVANKRWKLEISGMTVGEMSIPTDDRAKLLLMGASLSMKDEDTAPFVVGDASVVLTGKQFKAIYAALVAHVQALFTKHAAILSDIQSDKITTADEIEKFAWYKL